MNISKLIVTEPLIMIHFNVNDNEDYKITASIMESLVASTFSIDKEFPPEEIEQVIVGAKEYFGYKQGQELLMQITPPNNSNRSVKYGVTTI